MTDRAAVLMTGVWVSFRMEMLRLVRRRGALAMTFAAPVLISTVVVFALGSAQDPAAAPIAWVATSEDPSVTEFVDRVVRRPELSELVAWHRVESVAEATAAVAHEELGAAIVIRPADSGVGPAELLVLGDEDPISAGVAATIVDEYRVGHATALMALGGGLEAPERSGQMLVLTSPGGRSLDAARYWGPALGAFLVLLAMGHAAHRQVDDRHRGITDRVASTVTPRGAIVIGRSLAATMTGGMALVVMAASTQLVFGRSWGSWLQVGLVALATATAVAGVGALIAALTKTPGQAQSLTAVAAFVLALWGGSFSPLGSASEPGAVERWLPTSLSLEAFSVVATTGSMTGLFVPVVALVAIGTILLSSASLIADVRGGT